MSYTALAQVAKPLRVPSTILMTLRLDKLAAQKEIPSTADTCVDFWIKNP